MSDRYAAQLTIGGRLSPKQVDTLIDTLNGEGEGSLECGDVSFCPKTKQEILEALDKRGHLVIRNNEIRNGEFVFTEEALREAGIPYERWSDSYCEYDAEIVWWNDSMENPEGMICDVDGNLLCSMEPVKEALAILSNNGFIFNDDIQNVIKHLKSVVVEIPDLPKLEFEG